MQIRKKSVNTSKTILYFMYSNTIYILNNTIIEWFDIVLNITKRRFFKLQKNPKQKNQTKPNQKSPSKSSLPPCPKTKHHIFFFFWMDQWDKRIQWLAKSNSYCTHWQWNKKKEKKNLTFTITAPKKWRVEIFLECDDGVSLPWYTEGMDSHSHHRTRKEVKLEKN